ncbi:DNA topoisomerase (ATP-hydrolyzing) subunit B [Desulfurivibrio alkaliphilus]|uniref:DNA gyrase subunit B n=1 Tax=Desulfurivibrio alkaliphilus (strain DSM 19089 / UNIQEM U267 / AHT2) TaxID=589865 RepID=D6Z5P1_DESAT|nr:DNA topoisomerase (ATP-hydrolyzing) subunit B [Desulfurivibrio alkaliphilus]ADH86778.1 DNA gyrase, B subunit [Desulfurivibrio alkaliphilus AHT 2]
MSDNETVTNDYGAAQIKVLTGLEGVRKRPAMYIGNTAEEGLHHLVYEVVDNSIDEALAGYCDRIKITIHKDGSVSSEDNGRGIPVEIHPTEGVSALELVMCTLHAGGKFDHSTYKVSGGLHGVGVSVVNALSLKTIAEIKRNGKIHRQTYRYGVKEGEVEVVGETEKSGTKITFLPDPGIFTETTEFKYEIIQARLRELAFLNKNVKIKIHDERTGAEDEFHFKGGIKSFVEYLNRNRTPVHSEPVFVQGGKDNVQVEVAFQYFEGYTERLHSYVNNIYTKEGGSHVAGFRMALTKCINRYASDDIVPKNLREKLSGDDVREGITCIISTRVPSPQFEGQTKTKLGNSEVKYIVDSICHEKISRYLEENPQEARKILSKAVEAARAREAARRAKELSRKKGSGMDVLMAAKLAECQTKDPAKREIFLVEGDSAGGSAKQGRDRFFQAILPLRGKIMNVEKARFEKVLSSEEIKQIIAALGTGIGKEEFDLDKLRYHKIIIMTDADVDGAHIRTLLLTFFYRQMLPLVENGNVYIGQPPLYRLSRGKKEKFFLDDYSLNSFLFQQASTMCSVNTEDGRTVAGEELVALLKDLSHYQRLVEYLERSNLWEDILRFLVTENVHSADQFENEPLLNQLHQRLSGEKFILGNIRPCRWRPSCYEFDAALKDKAHLLVTVGPQIPLLPEYRQVLKHYPRVSPYLDGKFTVEVKNQQIEVNSWREMLESIRSESFKGSSLQRYKGLGEMNPEQLWATTMNPENRILLQVTIDDAEGADEIFTTLMGDKVEPRRDFIQSNALEVSSLDI